MRKNTNNIFMLAYVVFVFCVVFFKRHIDSVLWDQLVTAITATSWLIAISDFMKTTSEGIAELVVEIKGPLESYLGNLLLYREESSTLDSNVYDEYGMKTDRTVRDVLDGCESSSRNIIERLNKFNTLKEWLNIISNALLFLSFFLLFCTFIFKSVFSFFNSKIDGMTILAFGCILAGQLLTNYLLEYAGRTKEELTKLNNAWSVMNRVQAKEAEQNAD